MFSFVQGGACRLEGSRGVILVVILFWHRWKFLFHLQSEVFHKWNVTFVFMLCDHRTGGRGSFPQLEKGRRLVCLPSPSIPVRLAACTTQCMYMKYRIKGDFFWSRPNSSFIVLNSMTEFDHPTSSYGEAMFSWLSWSTSTTHPCMTMVLVGLEPRDEPDGFIAQ